MDAELQRLIAACPAYTSDSRDVGLHDLNLSVKLMG